KRTKADRTVKCEMVKRQSGKTAGSRSGFSDRLPPFLGAKFQKKADGYFCGKRKNICNLKEKKRSTPMRGCLFGRLDDRQTLIPAVGRSCGRAGAQIRKN